MSGRLKAGIKAAITVEPLDFTGWPADRAERRLRFIREYVITPKGVGAGEPMLPRPWQEQIVRGAFAEGIRTALVSVPRANGKSALAAALAVADLFCGDASAEVLVVATDQRQAEIVLRMAKRMIELSPELEARCHVYKDRLRVPQTDSMMMALPADPGGASRLGPDVADRGRAARRDRGRVDRCDVDEREACRVPDPGYLDAEHVARLHHVVADRAWPGGQ